MQARGFVLGLGLVAQACAKPPVSPPQQAPMVVPPEVEERAPVEQAVRAPVEEAPSAPEPVFLIDEERSGGACVEPARCPLRARLRPHASIHAGREEAEVLDELDSWHIDIEPMVVAAMPADAQARVELTCAEPGHWVSIFVEPSALAPVVLEPVQAVTRASDVGKSRREGLYLVAGTRVEVTKQKGDLVEVEAPRLRGWGWLASSALGTIHRPTERSPWSHPDEGRRTFDWRTVTVTDRPGGESFAELSGWIELRELGPRKGEQVLVAAGPDLDTGSHVVGWIEAEDLARGEGPHQGIPGGVPGGIPQRMVALEAETPLALGPWLVGGVVRPTEMVCAADCDTRQPQVLIWCGTILRVRAVMPPIPAEP